MAKLQRLHAAAGRLAEDAPEIIAHPEASRGLEQALIETMVDCLSERPADEDRAAQRRHSLIMRRFRRAVEENPDRALYIPELAAAIGVSLSTLRTCCHEQLGISPKRYLMLRRMHFALRGLREIALAMTTVTEIATGQRRCGGFPCSRPLSTRRGASPRRHGPGDGGTARHPDQQCWNRHRRCASDQRRGV
ncbi:MAG: helix-turn-helix transcriptional regulator [Planctomycetaceae bacterium]|nr:helix-turn-helix transcriptional regulator [Planctomycetaceae bacterium]